MNGPLEIINNQLESLNKETKEIKKELSKLKDLTLSWTTPFIKKYLENSPISS